MPFDPLDEVDAEILEAFRRNRGYAGFFEWSPDRDLAEYGAVESLGKSLAAHGALFFHDLAIRGRPNDPPDLEAVDDKGQRIGIEVTELVDRKAIQAYIEGRTSEAAEWARNDFLISLHSLLRTKNNRFPKLKGAPYPGGYVVVVFTDETFLPRPTVAQHLVGHTFSQLRDIDRAFLLLSYDPSIKGYPYFELNIQRA